MYLKMFDREIMKQGKQTVSQEHKRCKSLGSGLMIGPHDNNTLQQYK